MASPSRKRESALAERTKTGFIRSWMGIVDQAFSLTIRSMSAKATAIAFGGALTRWSVRLPLEQAVLSPGAALPNFRASLLLCDLLRQRNSRHRFFDQGIHRRGYR